MKNSYITISIITPSYNQGEFIEETILSVLDQNYPNLEYIVMDGGSTDNTIEILNKYTGRVKWFSKLDKGQANAINQGLSIATGSIVSYLNSDDLLVENALFKIAEIFANNPGIQWLVGRCKIIDGKSLETRKAVTLYKNLLLKTKSKNVLLVTDYISQPATFWKRELIPKIGNFNENLCYVMDYDYWLKLWEEGKPYFTDEYLAGFRVHQTSKTFTTAVSKTWFDEEKEVIKTHTNSVIKLFLHNAHRKIIEMVYSLMN